VVPRRPASTSTTRRISGGAICAQTALTSTLRTSAPRRGGNYCRVWSPSRIMASNRLLWSSDSVALVHIGPSSCIRSGPFTSSRTTPARWARPRTSSMAC